MEPSPQITYRGVDHSEALRALIERESAKLDRFFNRITSRRVLVEHDPQLREGAPFRVRIDVVVPGHELMSDASEHDADVAVREAFRRARRRLKAYAARLVDSHVRPEKPIAR
ncbi:MAG TPA: HPF/RaiA family ribosome-associated protein [Candidatus Cybelea sp.]|nr:HPF/RaiA family ribosome-associated protein [Candidatus Cybelea sp.]